MAEVILYHAPRACSRVTMAALEAAGLEYEDCPIDTRANQQRSAEYLAVNPMGKVPALRFDGQILTENAAILHFLHRQHPEAALLPPDSELGGNVGLRDLVWCGSSLHPITRQVRMPQRFTTGDPAGVREDGISKYRPILAMISTRLEESGYWYGDRWSIVDMYIYWNYSTAANGGLDLSDWPLILAHASLVRAHPAVRRALAREQAAAERLGLDLEPEALS